MPAQPIAILKELTDGLLHLFYPRLCGGCRQPLLRAEQVLCIGCTMQLPRTSFHHIPDNEAATRFAGRIPFVHATSLAWFTPDGLMQHLLHGLKYKGRQEYGTFFGRELGYELKDISWAATIDGIIPVPLHAKKERARGYNQSALIAEGLAEVLSKPVIGNVLYRNRYTESQTSKSRSERLTNVSNAFSLKGPGAVAGKHILLIDDVLTTGATLEAAAAVLIEQGAKVSIATVGIAAG